MSKKAKGNQRKPKQIPLSSARKVQVFFKNKALLKEVFHLSGVLLILCVIVAGILALSHTLTEEKIAGLAHERKVVAMETLVPGGEFVLVTDYAVVDPTIRAVYEVYQKGSAVGLCLETAPTGFGGEINLMIAIDLEGRIMGIDITKSGESAGGSNASNPDWLAQFIGKSGTLQVVKNKAAADNDIVALTGGTVTSKAVTAGVQSAVNFADSYYKGGGLS